MQTIGEKNGRDKERIITTPITLTELNAQIATNGLTHHALKRVEGALANALEEMKSNLRKDSLALADQEKLLLNKAIGDLWAMSAAIASKNPATKAAAEDEHRNATKFYSIAYRIAPKDSELRKSIFNLIIDEALRLPFNETLNIRDEILEEDSKE